MSILFSIAIAMFVRSRIYVYGMMMPHRLLTHASGLSDYTSSYRELAELDSRYEVEH